MITNINVIIPYIFIQYIYPIYLFTKKNKNNIIYV